MFLLICQLFIKLLHCSFPISDQILLFNLVSAFFLTISLKDFLTFWALFLKVHFFSKSAKRFWALFLKKCLVHFQRLAATRSTVIEHATIRLFAARTLGTGHALLYRRGPLNALEETERHRTGRAIEFNGTVGIHALGHGGLPEIRLKGSGIGHIL